MPLAVPNGHTSKAHSSIFQENDAGSSIGEESGHRLACGDSNTDPRSPYC